MCTYRSGFDMRCNSTHDDCPTPCSISLRQQALIPRPRTVPFWLHNLSPETYLTQIMQNYFRNLMKPKVNFFWLHFLTTPNEPLPSSPNKSIRPKPVVMCCFSEGTELAGEREPVDSAWRAYKFYFSIILFLDLFFTSTYMSNEEIEQKTAEVHPSHFPKKLLMSKLHLLIEIYSVFICVCWFISFIWIGIWRKKQTSGDASPTPQPHLDNRHSNIKSFWFKVSVFVSEKCLHLGICRSDEIKTIASIHPNKLQ